MKPDNQKSPQAVAAASEDKLNHIPCSHCQKQIRMDDNYCGYCGMINSKKTLKLVVNELKKVVEEL